MEDTEVKVWEGIFLNYEQEWKVRRQSFLNSMWASSVGSLFRMLVVSTRFLLLISLHAPTSRHCSKYQNASFLRGQVCPPECFHAHVPFQDKQRELYSFEL